MSQILTPLGAQITKFTHPYLQSVGLPHLAIHLPTTLLSLAFFVSLQAASSIVSPYLFPRTYRNLKPATRTSWDVHFAALVHAVLIVPLTARVWLDVRAKGGLNGTHELALNRTYGYTYEAGQVYAITLGYFIWDAAVSILHDGPGFIAHGVVCMTAFTLVFRPVFMYDGLGFLLWELSTPFLNIHWFLDKLGMTGSTLQLINAVFLLGSYVFARLTFGVYNSFSWMANTHFPPQAHNPPIPIFIKVFFTVGNITLNSLNFFWFRAMIRAIQKRFSAKPVTTQKSRARADGGGSGYEDDPVDPVRVLKGEQKVQVGVKGKDDRQFEKEALVGHESRAKKD